MTQVTSQNAMVTIRDLCKSYGKNKVLDGINLEVNRGTVSCIIGPSGSGKSTLIRCINGLTEFQHGSIQVQGQEVNDTKLDHLLLRRSLGMVFQQFNLFPHKTALENISMAPVHVLKEDPSQVSVRAHIAYSQGLASQVKSTPTQVNFPAASSSAWRLPEGWP